MSFHDITDIETALRSSSLAVRDLHAIWEQRSPIPDPEDRKKVDSGDAGAPSIAWLQQDTSLARLFTRRALEKEEYLLVSDAAREILRLSPISDRDSTELVHVRMDYAAALTRL